MSIVSGSKSRVAIFGFLFLGLSGLSACGSASPQDGDPVDVSVCKSDFEATVKQGPSAPLSLRGTLTLTGDSRGAIGYLQPTGSSDKVPVNAQFVDNDIALKFYLPDATIIRGQGPATSPLSQCNGQMTGGLTGPKAGDSGDWLVRNFAQDLACASRCYFHPPLPNSCHNLCNIYGYADGTAHFNSCYDDCVSAPAQYYCDSTTAFFDPCNLP